MADRSPNGRSPTKRASGLRAPKYSRKGSLAVVSARLGARLRQKVTGVSSTLVENVEETDGMERDRDDLKRTQASLARLAKATARYRSDEQTAIESLHTMAAAMLAFAGEEDGDAPLSTALQLVGQMHLELARVREAYVTDVGNVFEASIRQFEQEISETKKLRKAYDSDLRSFDAASSVAESTTRKASVEPMQLYEVKLERTEAKERYQESLQRLRTKTTDLKRRKEFQLVDDMARLSRLTQQYHRDASLCSGRVSNQISENQAAAEEARKGFTRAIVQEETRRRVDSENSQYDKYLPLIPVLSLPSNILILEAVVVTSESPDASARLIMYILDSRSLSVPVLKLLIDSEINMQGRTMQTLFRSNTMCSRLLTAFAKMVGNRYLRETLSQVAEWVARQTVSFETDRNKLASDDERDRNIDNLIQATQRVLDVILESEARVPLGFRIICAALQNAVAKRFPEASHTVIAGFLFLRFFCPALLFPLQNGLVEEEPEADAKRNLMLVSKVLQNLANGVQYNEVVSPGMELVNAWLDRHQSSLHAFLDSIADIDATTELEPLLTEEDVNRRCLPPLHHMIHGNMDLITSHLVEKDRRDLVQHFLEVMGDIPDD